VVDRGCLRLCEDDQDCIKGFYCDQERAATCLPAYDQVNGTCQAIRDTGSSCDLDTDCGVVKVDDGLCIGQEFVRACTIPCENAQDCPWEWQCLTHPTDPHAKVCVPN